MYHHSRCECCGDKFEQVNKADPFSELCEQCSEQELKEHAKHMNREYEGSKF